MTNIGSGLFIRSSYLLFSLKEAMSLADTNTKSVNELTHKMNYQRSFKILDEAHCFSLFYFFFQFMAGRVDIVVNEEKRKLLIDNA